MLGFICCPSGLPRHQHSGEPLEAFGRAVASGGLERSFPGLSLDLDEFGRMEMESSPREP